MRSKHIVIISFRGIQPENYTCPAVDDDFCLLCVLHFPKKKKIPNPLSSFWQSICKPTDEAGRSVIEHSPKQNKTGDRRRREQKQNKKYVIEIE